MALTLTVAQLSEAVRLTVSGSPAPPYLGILTRRLSGATEIIEGYADDAPDDIKNEAAIMLVGYWMDRPPTQNAFSLSGAQGLLSGWHMPVAAKVD